MHPEALSKKNKKICDHLAEFADFYLAGGTGLALQIGHRISVDFDLFSQKEISKNLLGKVKSVFSHNQIRVSVNNIDELTVFIEGIKISFIRYSFPVIFDLIDYTGFKLLSIKEIAVTKAYTIGRRGSLKDYIDLYFAILGSYVSLKEIIDIAGKKYKDEFNDRLFLEQLIYLDDLQSQRIIFLKQKVSRQQLKEFFEREIKKINLKSV